MRKKVHIDVWAGVVMLLASGWWLNEARRFPEVPRRFPMFVGFAFALVAVLILLGGLRKTKAAAAKQENPQAVIRLSEFKYVLIGFAGIVCYALLISVIHFFPATLIFVPAMMLFMRVRSWKQIVLTDLILNGLLYLVFVVELKISLP